MIARRLTLLATLTVTTLAMVPGLAKAAAPSWTNESIPSPPARTASLHAVSCAAMRDCVAVGNAVNRRGGTRVEAEHWTGSGWQVERVPTPGWFDSDLSGVSCPTADSCVAVGRYAPDTSTTQHTLAVVRDGSTWRRVSTPNPDGGGKQDYDVLSAVSCPSTSFCLAVGSLTGVGNHLRTLAMTWDGTAWTVADSPDPAASDGFDAVSCTAATSCMVTGSSGDAPLAAQWDGTGFTVLTTPAPGNASLDGVTCLSADSCTAVGHSSNSNFIERTLVEFWNGSRWRIVGSPNADGARFGSALDGVACRSADSCVAVGTANGFKTGTTSVAKAIGMSWDGTSWQLRPVPAPHAEDAALTGVSCVATRPCLAVGRLLSTFSTPEQPLTLTWNDTKFVTAPGAGRSGTATGTLSDVSCTSAAVCMAVGRQLDLSTGRYGTFAERRTGAGWTIVPTPATGTDPSSLHSVSCTAANNCVAVGVRGPDGVLDGNIAPHPLAMHWDGSAWTILATADPPSHSTLDAVSCTSANWCLAVGSIAEEWDGTQWMQVTVPSPSGSFGEQLSGVSCVDATDCVGVGYAEFQDPVNPELQLRSLEEHWNGTAWTIQTDATVGDLQDVSCTAAGHCLAVGIGPDLRTLAEVSTGATWSKVPSPSPERLDNTGLSSISCSGDRCAAVGFYSAFNPHTSNDGGVLIDYWNGTHWVNATAENVSGETSPSLDGVSCTTAARCVAVGQSGSPYPVPLAYDAG